MTRFLSQFTLLLISIGTFAQGETWTADVAPIIFENCTFCHREGGIGAFPLMTYEDAYSEADDIKHAVEDREMPPWPADPNYRHFVDENVLTQEEIETIVNWVDYGRPYGNAEEEPDPPTFPEFGSNLESIDFVAQIEPYTLQFNYDEYRYFVIPTNFTEPVWIKKIEVISGLPAIIHHADVSYDITGNSYANDLLDPLSGFNYSVGGPTYSFYMNAWQPGAGPAIYPEDWAIELPPGADLVFEIHYGPGGIGLTDTTKMNFEFMANPEDARPVYASWILGQSPPILQEPQLFIPANQISTFHQISAPAGYSRSLISICPHMHLLGKSYKVWMETQEGDSIGLIDIPQWDFHWQMYYMFEQVQVVPPGAVLKSIGVYDNTLANPENPFSPPQNVYAGSSTLDEMFLCYFIWSNYQVGDEDIILADEVTGVEEPDAKRPEFVIYPNPSSGTIYIQGDYQGKASVDLFDQTGRLVHSHEFNRYGLDVEKLNLNQLPNGIYTAVINSNYGSEAHQIVLNR